MSKKLMLAGAGTGLMAGSTFADVAGMQAAAALITALEMLGGHTVLDIARNNFV